MSDAKQEWQPPAGAEFVEELEDGLPGLPQAKVRRIVVHAGLRSVPELVIVCPRCNAEGADQDPKVIQHVGRGGQLRLDCTQCGLRVLLRRPPRRKVQVVGGLSAPEVKAFDAKLIMGGK